MKVPGLNGYSGLLFGLLAACAFTATDTAAQAVSAGGVFPLFGTEEFCESSTFGAFQVGFETPIAGSVDGQIEGYIAPAGFYPWPWNPIGGEEEGGGEGPSAYDHDGGVRIAFNALVPLTQADRFGLKLLGGVGLRRLGAAEYSAGGDGDIERFGVESQTSPLVTFGVVADIGLNDRIGVRLQGRGNAIFSGDLNLVGANNQTVTVAGDTQTFGQAMIGLTFATGDRR